MPALNLIITNAGASALAQAGSVGPVALSQIAVGSGIWTPDVTATALHTQVAEFAAVGSVSATAGMIHVTAEDSTGAAYTCYEMGIFTSTGILFAIYSQDTPIFVKASGSAGLIACDFVISGLPAGAVTVGVATFQYPPATEEAQGVAAIATTADVAGGADNTTIVTPAKLVAWVSSLFLKASNALSELSANAAVARGNLGLGTAATQNIPPAFPGAGNANFGQVVMGNDTRLSDARNPIAASVVPTSLSVAAINSIIGAVNAARYPVGEIFITHQAANSDAVAALLQIPGSVWGAYGSGQVLVGYKAGDANFGALDQTGGAATVTLTTAQIPAHSHPDGRQQTTVQGPTDNSSGNQTTLDSSGSGKSTGNNAGGGGAHNNLQPYITVYFWIRTA